MKPAIRTSVIAACVGIATLISVPAHAKPGQLDHFFSSDGRQTAFASGGSGYAVALDDAGTHRGRRLHPRTQHRLRAVRASCRTAPSTPTSAAGTGASSRTWAPPTTASTSRSIRTAASSWRASATRDPELVWPSCATGPRGGSTRTSAAATASCSPSFGKKTREQRGRRRRERQHHDRRLHLERVDQPLGPGPVRAARRARQGLRRQGPRHHRPHPRRRGHQGHGVRRRRQDRRWRGSPRWG